MKLQNIFITNLKKKWYAIAILERKKTASIYQNYIEKNDAAIRQAIKESEKNPGTFYGYSEICFATEISAENDKLVKNLTVIDFEKGTEISKKVVSFQKLQLDKKSLQKIFLFM